MTTFTVLLEAEDRTQCQTQSVSDDGTRTQVLRCPMSIAHSVVLRYDNEEFDLNLCCLHADQVELWRECVASIPIGTCHPQDRRE